MSLKSTSGDFSCLAFSTDGRYLYVGGNDNVLRLWDIDLVGQDDAPTAIEANGPITSISASADCWIAASADAQVRRYKKASLELESSLTSTEALAARCVAVDPRGKMAAVASDNFDLKIIELNNILNVQLLSSHRRPVRKVTWHPKDQLLTSCGCEGNIIVWDTSGDRPLKPIAEIEIIPTILDTKSPEYLYDCSAVWHPSGDYFFVASRSRDVVSVRRSDWKEDQRYLNTRRPGSVTALAVSPNGAYLATSTHRHHSKHCSSHTNEKDGFISQLAFSPNANVMAWTSEHREFLNLGRRCPVARIAPPPPAPIETPEETGLDDFTTFSDIEDEAGDGPDEDDANFDQDDDDDGQGRVKEMVNITKAQPPFQPGETPLSQTKRFLAINRLGSIETTIVPNTDHCIIDVKFFDESKRSRIHFTDDLGYNLGYLGDRGVLFARRRPPKVLFKPYLDGNSLSEWTYTPHSSAHVLGIAAGSLPPPGSTKNTRDSDLDGFGNVVVATVDGGLTFLSGTGRERRILGLGGDFVSMVAGHEWVFVVHRAGSTTIDGSQNLSYSLINFEDLSVRQRGFLPMPKNSTLKWIGITEEGAPAMFDTTGRVHVLTKYRIPHHASWARVMDTEILERKQGKDESYWPIAIFGSTLLCFILKGQEPYPKNPLPPPQELPIEMPFTTENKAEEKIERENLLLEILRDGLDDELTNEEIVKTEQVMDKELVLLIQSACKLNQIPRAIELAKLIHNARFLDSVLKIAQFYRFDGLEEKIQSLKSIREAEEDRLVLAREKRRQWTRPDPLPRPLSGNDYMGSAPARPFQHFDPPPAISRPGLAPAIPVKETTRFPASSASSVGDESIMTADHNKRKRDDIEDFSSSQDQKANPFARKNGQEKNPFAAKPGANRTIQKSDSFFDKVDAADDLPKTKRAPKGKDKEKKGGPKQTTLFGMLSSARIEKNSLAVESQDSDASMSDVLIIESQPELPEEWEETQPVDMEVDLNSAFHRRNPS
ncbi:hypothetical protein C8F01DRAFT_1205930 [Mycena amicta]|nr:hypothetical protein C8F01DRAFT_1205930 [Mycena amicta]